MSDVEEAPQLTLEVRLAAVRERIKQGRDDNLGALEEEAAADDLPPRPKKRRRHDAKRRYDASDDEEDDPIVRAINARAAQLPSSAADAVEGEQGVPAVYGGATTESDEALQRLADDVAETEARRARYNRRRAFVADKANVSFIDEGNRTYNRVLSKHYDAFDNVRKIKESLERGTAL